MLGDMAVWHGERGRVYFYQSELPYDVVPGSGYENQSGYVVAEHVKSHEAVGVGVYSFFRDHEVLVETAIRAPAGSEDVRFVNAFTRHLNGHAGIQSLFNGRGAASGPEEGVPKMARLPSNKGASMAVQPDGGAVLAKKQHPRASWALGLLAAVAVTAAVAVVRRRRALGP